jgi:adenylate cyclase
MLSPETKRNIARIVPVALICLLFSIVYTLPEKGLLAGLTLYLSTGSPYNFSRNIFVIPASALVTGIFVGTLEIKYFYGLFSRMRFMKKIVVKSIAYVAIIITFLLLVTAISNSLELQRNIFSSGVWNKVLFFLSAYAFRSVVVYSGAIIIVSPFYTEVSRHLGQEFLASFFKITLFTFLPSKNEAS